MEITQEELEKGRSVVNEWVKDLTETSIAQKLDRSALRMVLEDLGAVKEISEEERRSFFGDRYSNADRAKAMRSVWGENYGAYKSFCEQFSFSEVKFKETGTVDKTAGMRQFFGELTALAYTNEEEFTMGDFIARITAQAVNGRLREAGFSARSNRMLIRVPGYNTMTYRLAGQDESEKTGELPFAPASFPTEFPQKAWEFINTWKK
jgi:hypothetical protein